MQECDALLNKYHWYDIQKEDLELCKADGAFGCEVPGVLHFFDEVDNVVWKISEFGNDQDAVCLKMEHGSWSFADVRGCIK